MSKGQIVLSRSSDGEVSLPEGIASEVMIAESKPSEKEMMVNLVMNFLA